MNNIAQLTNFALYVEDFAMEQANLPLLRRAKKAIGILENLFSEVRGRDRFSTKAAAAYLGFSVRLLESLRKRGLGPEYYQPPGTKKIIYFRADLDSWVKAGKSSVYETRGLIQL